MATEEDLARTLFGPSPAAEILVAKAPEGKVAGFALFFHNYSTFEGKRGLYLEDLYVRDEFRGQGLGRTLLARLAEIAVQRDCARFEWMVLDWNQRAIDFYRSVGATPLSEWTTFRLEGEALQKLAG